MVTVFAVVLAFILVTACGLVIGMGGAGDFVARLNPVAKLSVFGVVLVLVAAAGWTVGSVVGPIDDQPPSVVPEHGDNGSDGHGDR